MESLADTRAACERAQVDKLALVCHHDPGECVAEIAAGLRLCKTDVYCRKLARTVDAVVRKLESESQPTAPKKVATPSEKAGKSSLSERAMALLLELKRPSPPAVPPIRGRRSD